MAALQVRLSKKSWSHLSSSYIWIPSQLNHGIASFLVDSAGWSRLFQGPDLDADIAVSEWLSDRGRLSSLNIHS